MKHLFFFLLAIGLFLATAHAEPVADLKSELKARRKVVNDWFKAELIKIARQSKTDEERQKVLTACEWEWDAGKAGVTWITLREGGSGTHHHQGSSFAWTIEGWMLKLVFPSGVMTLKFDPDTLKFTGKDSRKNTIKGSPKLEP
jgi:hypothetical protein